MQVKLSGCDVELKDELTWGDNEEIQAEIMSALKVNAEMRALIEKKAREATQKGVAVGEDDMDLGEISMDGKALLASKYKAAQVLITKITQHDGTEVKYSKEWLHGLSMSDGSLLQTHIQLVRSGNATAKK